MVLNVDYARQLAEQLLAIQSVILNPEKPFTWSSGWKSPIYCDNRLILSYPEIREQLKHELTNACQNISEDLDAIVGVATAGIPHATLVADSLNLPLVYVRSSPKAHGTENKVEGRLKKGQRVVVIEDLISTGRSSISVVEALREIGCQVQKLTAIFTYEFDRASSLFRDHSLHVDTLTNYSVLIKVAKEKGYIPESAMETLNEWRADPKNWGIT